MKSYLSHVRFDKKLLNSFHAKYVVNFRLVLLLIISIVVLGIASFVQVPRRLNPELNIPIVTVVTALPGGSPSDVESLITIPIEDKIKNIKGIDTMNSASRENFSVTAVQFRSTINSQRALDDIKSAVEGITEFPKEAKTPIVKLIDFEDQPIWTFAITTTADTASLMRFAKKLRDAIEDNPKVDRVQVSGFDEQEIEVVIDPIKMREFNISPLLLSTLIQNGSSSFPAGSVTAATSTFAFSFDRQINTLDDIRAIRIGNGPSVITLGDIATISEVPKHDQTEVFLATAHDQSKVAVAFFVFKSSGINIDAAEKEVKKIVDEHSAASNNQFTIVSIINSAQEITTQFNDLFGEFRSAVILVFINLFIFLGLRQAVISSLTVPLTFFSAITIINMLGMSLNFLTMFSFLLALGLLIDDTIVTVAAMTRYYRSGNFTPAQTGLLVWRDFIVPLWSTTITTIWAFVPLLLATGIIGEFIKPIPIVVTATMLSSTSIAVLITLPLMIVALRPQLPKRVQILVRVLALLIPTAIVIAFTPKTLVLPVIVFVWFAGLYVVWRARASMKAFFAGIIRRRKWAKTAYHKAFYVVENGIFNIESLSFRYMKLIDRILASRFAMAKTLFVVIIFAVVSYMLVPTGLVSYEFFPKTDEDIIYISGELPAGTNRTISLSEGLSLLNDLRGEPDVDFAVLETGSELDANFDRSGNSSSFLITLHLAEDRTRTSIVMAQDLRNRLSTYTKGTLSVRELSGGPPAGADVQIKLSGDDLGVLNTYADQVANYLSGQPGLTNVSKSIKPSTAKIVFVPDSAKMARSGVTNDAIGLWMRTFATGLPLDAIKFGDNADDTDIVFRMYPDTLNVQDIAAIAIPTQTGGTETLASLGHFELASNPILISREEGKRTISVFAGVNPGVSATKANQDLLAHTKTINLPSGYVWKTGGANEENQKSVNSILQAMILSFLLILVTMVIEFHSYRQAAITLLAIPLAIPGVFYLFGLTGTPLSFPSLIGILALFGIVVTNAIVVVEKINENRGHGMELRKAIVEASGSRLEPILLTSITSILGLIPITLSDPLWRGLGGAIISGLLFSGLIKLFFVPVMYYWWYGGASKNK